MLMIKLHFINIINTLNCSKQFPILDKPILSIFITNIIWFSSIYNNQNLLVM